MPRETIAALRREISDLKAKARADAESIDVLNAALDEARTQVRLAAEAEVETQRQHDAELRNVQAHADAWRERHLKMEKDRDGYRTGLEEAAMDHVRCARALTKLVLAGDINPPRRSED